MANCFRRNTQAQMSSAVQNFIKSLGGGASLGGVSIAQGKAFTTLPDLLSTSTTIAMIDQADEAFIDNLLARELPSTLIALEMDPEASDAQDLDQETADAVVMSLDLDKKRSLAKKVLRSPQFAQSLASLTGALRDGGLPNVSQALGVEVKNGGYTGSSRQMPLEGGDAVEAFLEGVKDSVRQSGNHDAR
jgi:26S proteasome regulatory subunit N13